MCYRLHCHWRRNAHFKQKIVLVFYVCAWFTTSSLNLALASVFPRVGTPQAQTVAASADVEACGSLCCAANGLRHNCKSSLTAASVAKCRDAATIWAWPCSLSIVRCLSLEQLFLSTSQLNLQDFTVPLKFMTSLHTASQPFKVCVCDLIVSSMMFPSLQHSTERFRTTVQPPNPISLLFSSSLSSG